MYSVAAEPRVIQTKNKKEAATNDADGNDDDDNNNNNFIFISVICNCRGSKDIKRL
jgi:hypothetical protein